MGNARDKYGPYAFIAPAEDLGSPNGDVDFQTPQARLVGLVYVDPGELPSTYKALRLQNGISCVYLIYAGRFRAYMSPLPAGAVCQSSMPPNPALELAVMPSAPPGGFANPADVPAVARFHEGTKGHSKGDPLIGLRCGNKWCMILPAGADTTPTPFQGKHANHRTWAVHGWNDSQELALPTGTPGQLKRSGLEAGVIADTMLRVYNAVGRTFPDTLVRAATVLFNKKPVGKYASDWKFRQGENEIWLKRVSDMVYIAELREPWPSGKKIRDLFVNRFDHNHPIPASARFLWNKDDDDVWVACEDGCCRVANAP